MKALYICDNKEEWGLLSNLFKAHFSKIELICALKTNQALDYLTYEGPFGIIIIDASLKQVNPSDFGEQILEVAGERPLIFVGDKVTIRDRIRDELYLGHDLNAVIYKPYDIDHFREIIQTSLNWAREEEFEQSVEEFERSEMLPMKLRNFYLFEKIDYDVYVELTQTKYAKVIAAKKPYTHNTIQNYAKKNIKYLYLKKNEYLRFLEESIEDIMNGLEQTQNPKKIISLQIKSIVIIHQYIRSVGVSDSLIELVQNVIDKTTQNYQSVRTFKNILAHFPRINLDLAEHSVLSLYLCESVCESLSWNSDITKKKLGLASILQDTGLTNEDLLKINRLDDPHLQMFSEEDREEFKNHPAVAAGYSQYFTRFPEVDYLISQHHEMPNGEGFPNKLNANKLTVLSCTFILCSHYLARLVCSKVKSENLLQEVYYQFKLMYNTGNFKEPLVALEKTLRKTH